MTQENRKPWIITIVILLMVIFLISISISGVFQTGMTSPNNSLVNRSSTFIDTNSSPSKLPSDMKPDIDRISRDVVFSVNKWEFDPVKKDIIILYTFDIRNESLIEDLQGKQIKKYTLRIIHDTEFETTRKEVSDYLYDLRKNPEYQINSVYMVTDRINDPPANNAEVWVYKSTPENMKLDKTLIKGWKIKVYPMTPLPSESEKT